MSSAHNAQAHTAVLWEGEKPTLITTPLSIPPAPAPQIPPCVKGEVEPDLAGYYF